MSQDIRYHFGPRDQRGLLLGVRLGQIAILATGAFARHGRPARRPRQQPAAFWRCLSWSA